MDGDKGRICDEIAIRGEEGTGIVEAFLNVCGDGSLLERAAHGLGDAHESVRKEREENRIWFSRSHGREEQETGVTSRDPGPIAASRVTRTG